MMDDVSEAAHLLKGVADIASERGYANTSTAAYEAYGKALALLPTIRHGA